MANEKDPKKKRGISVPKIVSVCLLAAVLIGAALIYSLDSGVFPWSSLGDVSPYPDGAEFHFIDVGQGDATLIRTPDGCVLIDAGANSAEDKLRAYLDSLGIDEIRYCVFTHPDEDHVGGGDMIMKEYAVRSVLVPDAESDAATYGRLTDVIADSGSEVIYAAAGQTFSVGDVTFTVLSPDGEAPETNAVNDLSIVIVARIGNVSFMLMGDAETAVEEKLVRAFPGDELRCTVLKAGHHGSSTSAGEKWLDAVSPEYAVISCGADNTYGHPHLLTLTRLQKRGAKIYRTDENGNVVFYTDGDGIEIRCGKDK